MFIVSQMFQFLSYTDGMMWSVHPEALIGFLKPLRQRVITISNYTSLLPDIQKATQKTKPGFLVKPTGYTKKLLIKNRPPKRVFYFLQRVNYPAVLKDVKRVVFFGNS